MRLQHLLLLLSCTSIVANLLDNAKAGDLAGIKVDLANDEQDIEETSKDGYTALIYATAKGHEDVVKYLIQQGANTNAVDDIGTSVLSFALKKEEYSIASMLKKAGATKEGKVTQSDADDAAKNETPPTTTPPKKTKKKKTKTKPIEEPENTQWLDQVKHLKDDEFTMFKQFNPRFLAFFYAPWCGHCKAAKPEFGAAAGEATIPLVAFDCTKDAKSTCEQYSVSSFPQIKYFDSSYKAQEKSQGEEYIAYEGGRTAKALLKFILRQDPDYIKPPFENLTPEDWGSKESGLVIHMNDDDFDSFRSKKNRFLSMFYAPWCGHCKQAKPDFAVASQKFRRSMPFLAMDCTSEGTETCQKLNITSYPSFYYFNADSDPEDASAHFATQRSSGAYITYVEKKLSEMDAIENDKGGEINYKKLRVKALRKMLKDRGVKCRGCTEKLHFIERVQETIHLPIKSKKIYKKGGKTLIQEKREKVLAVNAEKGWNIETYGNGNVIHSYDGHFQEVLLKEKKQTMVVFFYAPWCGHCKQAKPDIVQVSNELLDYNNPIRKYIKSEMESVHRVYGSHCSFRFLFLLLPPNLFHSHSLVLFYSKTPKQVFFNVIYIFGLFLPHSFLLL